MSAKEKIEIRDNVHYFRQGWKQEIGNMTKIYVKGNDYERGFQFGKLCSAELREIFKSFLAPIMNGLKKSRVSKCFFTCFPFLLGPLIILLYRKQTGEKIKKYPVWVERELEGMAAGSGINPFYFKFFNVMGDDENLLGAREPGEAAMKSCCSFAFTGKDGNIYHGKNLDWIANETFIDLMCFQQREDEEGHSFSIIGVPGLLNGCELGMNSHGISIGLTGRFYKGKHAPKLSLTNAVELKILRYAKNFEDIKHAYNTKTGFNRSDGLLISSLADKNYRLFEVTPMGVAATGPTDGVLFNTNSYIHPMFHKNNKQWGNVFNNRFCDPRHKRLQELMAKKPGTIGDAFNILKDTVQPGFQHKTFLGQATINRFITHVSALMIQGENPGVSGAWIARDRAYAAANKFVFFDFSALPQATAKIKEADKIIDTEPFKNFKEFMHIRESRYYLPPDELQWHAQQLLAKEPGNPIFILFLAQNYFKYGKFAPAIDILEKHPIEWLADYWYCLGKCRYELKQYESAKENFSQALKLPPVDGFIELVETLCLVQLLKVNEKLGLQDEVNGLTKRLQTMKAGFPTPNIGMPDYPYINNIVEQLEQVML